MIETIFLDLEDTVYPFEGTEAKAAAEDSGVHAFCEETGLGFEDTFIAFCGVVDVARAEPSPYRNDRRKWFEKLGARTECTSSQAVEKAFSAYWATLLSKIRPFPDALEVLPWLAKNFDVRLASEGMRENQLKRLRALGLEKYFSAVHCADEYGLLKSPAFYKKVVSEARIKTSEAVMIGNSLLSDIEPAARVGLKTIWINRFFEKSSQHGFVRSFYHAKKILAEWNKP